MEKRKTPLMLRINGWLDRAEEERAREPHVLQRLAEDARPEALEVDNDVG